MTDPSQRPGFTTDAGHARIRLYYKDIFLGLSGPEVTQEAGYGLAEESDLHPVLAEPSYPPESHGQDTLIAARSCDDSGVKSHPTGVPDTYALSVHLRQDRLPVYKPEHRGPRGFSGPLPYSLPRPTAYPTPRLQRDQLVKQPFPQELNF